MEWNDGEINEIKDRLLSAKFITSGIEEQSYSMHCSDFEGSCRSWRWRLSARHVRSCQSGRQVSARMARCGTRSSSGVRMPTTAESASQNSGDRRLRQNGDANPIWCAAANATGHASVAASAFASTMRPYSRHQLRAQLAEKCGLATHTGSMEESEGWALEEELQLLVSAASSSTGTDVEAAAARDCRRTNQSPRMSTSSMTETTVRKLSVMENQSIRVV